MSDLKYDISIIIPNYNSTDKLINCLKSIYEQKTSCNYEVIVVDSSDIDPLDEIKNNYPDVEIIHFNKRVYPGTARNIGVEKSSGKIIAFTDADCIVCSGWIDKIYHAHGGKIKIIGGSVKNGFNRNLIATAEYLIEFSEFLPRRNKGFIELLPTCNFTIQREIFNNIGGFKGLITGEDTLLSFEIQRSGENILFNPNISITHFNRRNLLIYIKKQKELGIGSFFLRKEIHISGSWLTKFRIFSILIPGLRCYTTLKKVIIYDFMKIFILIFLFPLVLLGLIAYSYGFWRAFKINTDVK